MRRDLYTDRDYGIQAPVGFAVLTESNRQGDNLYYACDRIYDASGNIICPLDEHFKSLDDIARRCGETYYISQDEGMRNASEQKMQ